MRMLLSIAGLLIVLVTVMQLVKSQLGGIAAVTGGPSPAASPGAARPPAQQAADQITRAIEAGAAARAASDAER